LASASKIALPSDRTPDRALTTEPQPGPDGLVYRFERCELRPGERLLQVGGESVNLGPRAFDVLLALVEGCSRVVSKSEMLERDSPDQQVEEHNLAMQISLLRRLVGRQVIATVPGRGYRLATSVACEHEPARPVRTQLVTSDAEPSTDTAPPAGSPRSPPTHGAALRFGRLEWRPNEALALLDGRRAEIGSRAVRVLEVLIRERHRVVSKGELLQRVWPDAVVEENTLQAQVSALRKLLGQEAVATISGRGYRFTMRLAEDHATPTGLPIASRTATVREAQIRTNLPYAMEALFGRAEDLEQLERLLAAHRLVTIVGAGGIGKTRAAQALAREQAARFQHGAWWVDVGALASPDELAPAIAAAARVQMGAGDAVRQLALALQPRHTLIVLDNCEHLVESVARIAATVLDGAEMVRLLATSQEPLHIEGEQLYRLSGLHVPPAGASLDEARCSGALMLLERRAQAGSGDFALTDPMVPAAVELCRQLDGIPRAIEMAAARLPQLGATALQTALGERLQWLRSSVRAAPTRQQTLRAALDWSFSLLGAREQAVLRRLSSFAGSFRLESAQRVAAELGLDGWAVADAMSTLVERSLIQVVGDEDTPRYRLLETMRLYSNEQLRAHGETACAQAAHMRVMAAIGNEAEQSYWTTPDDPWRARYEPEYDDLHSAFTHACKIHDAAAGAATLDALYRLDELRELPIALGVRLAPAHALLSHADAAAELRIRLVIGALFVAQIPTEGISKLEAVRPAADLARRLQDPARLYRALMSIVVHGTVAGDGKLAAPALAEAEALEDDLWPARLKWFGAIHRSIHCALRGDSAGAMESLRRELTYATQAGSLLQASSARASTADISLMCGDFEAAIRLGGAVVEEARSQGRDHLLAAALANLCAALVVGDDLRRAAEVAAEAIDPVWRYNRIGYLLDHLSLLAAKQGHFEDSLRLIGFTDAWWSKAQYAREGNEAAAVRGAMVLNERALGAREAARIRKLGASHSLEAARQLALSCVGARGEVERHVGKRAKSSGHRGT
jgi:predicted ATPase/DNA-binding winged helix-turn-helix (wHTH) protein